MKKLIWAFYDDAALSYYSGGGNLFQLFPF